MTACAFNIAKVLFDVEAVGDGPAVVDFTRERTRCITLVICLVVGIRVVRIEIKSMLQAMGCIQLERSIVCFSSIERAEKLRPIGVRRPRISPRDGSRCRKGRRTRRDLVQVFSNTQPVGVHSHIACTNGRVARDLPLHSHVPLIRLRIAIARVYTLIETSPTNLRTDCGRCRVGEPDLRTIRSCRVEVRVSMQALCRVAAVVERQRTKISHGVDAEARTYNRLRIVEGSISYCHARLEVSFIGIAQALRQPILARGHILRARKRVVIQVASVEELLEGNVSTE